MPRSRPPQPYAHADPAIGIPEQLQPAQHQQALHAPPGGTQACRAPQEQQHGQHHAAQQQQQAGLPADTARQALRTPQQPHQPRHPQQQQLRQHGLAGMQHRPHKPHAAGSRMQQQQHRGQRPGQPLAATADGPSAAQQQQQARDGPVSPAEHTCAEAASPAAGSQCQKPLASPAPAFTTPQQQRAPRQVHRSQQGQRQSGPEQPAPRKLLADHGVTIRGPAPSSAAVQGAAPCLPSAPVLYALQTPRKPLYRPWCRQNASHCIRHKSASGLSPPRRYVCLSSCASMPWQAHQQQQPPQHAAPPVGHLLKQPHGH